MRTPPPKKKEEERAPIANVLSHQGQRDEMKEDWINWAKGILTHIQLRDNLEKTVVMRDYDGNESRILLHPKSSLDSEEGCLLEVAGLLQCFILVR
jgi:hypothetical protein